MSPSQHVSVSIVIVTRNRVDCVKQALASCRQQQGATFEVLVYDDASEDDTVEVIQSQFPEARLFQNDQRTGYITLRNQGFRDARGEFVLSIDDDAYFTGSDTLKRVVDFFGRYPKMAAVAMPFVEPNRPRESYQQLADGQLVRHYIGCAHALRREIALDLGEYPELLVHQGEERDLCIRILDHGYEIRFGDMAPIVHDASPIRDTGRINYYGFRNTFVFAWMRVPTRYLPLRLIKDTVGLLKYKFSLRTLGVRFWAVASGWWFPIKHRGIRRSVTEKTYLQYSSLPYHTPQDHRSLDLNLSKKAHDG